MVPNNDIKRTASKEMYAGDFFFFLFFLKGGGYTVVPRERNEHSV